MARFLIIGDVHFTLTAPARRKPEYGAQILAKLAHLAMIANQLDAMAIFTGDLFHRKRPTLAEVYALLEVLKEFNRIPLAVVGNHDVIGHNSGDLEGTGIGILFESGVLEDLERAPFPHSEFFGVEVTGADYCPHYEQSDPYLIDDTDKPRIHVTHGMLVEEPLPFEIDQTCVEVVEVTLPPKTLLVNGHVHTPFDRHPIYNVGSVCRASIEDQKTNHQPRALVVQWTRKDWKVVPVEIPVDADVWTDEDERPEAMKSDAIAEFVATLEEAEDLELQAQHLLGRLFEERAASSAVINHVRALLEGATE